MSKKQDLENSHRLVAFLKDKAMELDKKREDTYARNVSVVTAREQLFLDQYEEILAKVFSKRNTKRYTPSRNKKSTKRILNLLLSDLHYGANLDKKEVGHRYGPVEEARRTAYVALSTANYKRRYRDDTELYIHLLGDIIQGQLHDLRDGSPLAEQVASAQNNLIQAIEFLAREFPRGVTVFCTTGNHGRNTARHHNRATNQKWDSIETLVYLGVRAAFRNNPRVKFVIPKTPYYTYSAFANRGLMTHGDTVIKPGFPGNTIDVKRVTHQINAINAAMGKKINEEYNLFGVGHVHTDSVVNLPGKTVFLSNGCLIPSDAYAISIGYFDVSCGQKLWESVPKYIFGDNRFISVDFDTDADSSLDQIVSPYEDFSK